MKKTRSPNDLTRLAVDALEELKGLDLRVLDVSRLTPITDAMVICTGTSSRHVKSLAEAVIERAKRDGHRPRGVEGLDQGEWVLVDLGDVVVHVMQAQTRAFYQLEKLWDFDAAEAPARLQRG
ncbi:MAG: ribosome silencing factor [Gammaproteobacteria bacterium]|nr:ribosome silencing factor [Gammaproteobacteria bacterium]